MAGEAPLLSDLKDKLQTCIHCGLCLEHCPTYVVTEEEMSSPRGRIHLMKGVAEGSIAITDPALHEHEFSCVVCRSCETACPSGVQFSVLMEHTRDEIVRHEKPNILRTFIYTSLLGSPRLTNIAQWLLALGSKIGILGVVKRLAVKEKGFLFSTRLLPDTIHFPKQRREVYPTSVKKIGTVGLLIGCISDVFTEQVNDATITVLNKLGYDVRILPSVTCCGALAAHAGYLDRARSLARTTHSAIQTSGIDFFISSIAGCGAMLKDYPSLLGEQIDISRIKDISEFLYEYHYDDIANWGLHFKNLKKISYQAPCHLYHGQKIIDTPIHLLSLIGNAEVTALPENELCCGSAGTYNLERPEMAEALLKRKLALIDKENPKLVATANAGCLMQVQSGLQRGKAPQQVYHFIEIIASLI